MDRQQKRNTISRRRKFSTLSIILGTLFIIAIFVAVFVDLVGLLQYFSLISGSATATLEAGAIITVASIAPFLAMGFSISADLERNE